MELTTKETDFMNATMDFIYEDHCGSNPIDILEDNHISLGIEDWRKNTKFTKHQIAGLISSLENKDCIILYETKQENDYMDLYYVTDTYLKSIIN